MRGGWEVGNSKYAGNAGAYASVFFFLSPIPRCAEERVPDKLSQRDVGSFALLGRACLKIKKS